MADDSEPGRADAAFVLRYSRRRQARPGNRNSPRVSAAHVSATLAKAGHQRADEPRTGDYSGFVVTTDGGTVGVAYQSYDVDPCSGMPPEVAVAIEAAFEGYAATLRAARYQVQDWTRPHDGVRLGLLVTGRKR